MQIKLPESNVSTRFPLQSNVRYADKSQRRSWLSILLLVLIGCGSNSGTEPIQQTGGADTQKTMRPEHAATTATHPEGTAVYQADDTIGAEQLGMPIYPNATRLKSGTWDIRDPRDGSEALTALQLRSEDPITRVAEYYREKLKDAQFIEIDRASGKRISITISLPDQTTSSAVLFEDGTGTRIEITKLGQSEARSIK